MRIYHCVDLMNPGHSEDIEASSSDIAMKRYFKSHGISEVPVRSAKQAHKQDFGRFYTKTNHDNDTYKARHVFIGFNRQGFEFNSCISHEFDETLGKDLPWAECDRL